MTAKEALQLDDHQFWVELSRAMMNGLCGADIGDAYAALRWLHWRAALRDEVTCYLCLLGLWEVGT